MGIHPKPNSAQEPRNRSLLECRDGGLSFPMIGNRFRKLLWCIMPKIRRGLRSFGILKIKSKVSHVSLDASRLVAVSDVNKRFHACATTNRLVRRKACDRK